MDNDQFLKSSLRAVLQSCKGGVEGHRLLGDYKGLVGEPIPYRQRGFNTLDEFLIKYMADVVRISVNHLGEKVYLPIADASSAHIQRMVSAQRSTKKKSFVKKAAYKPMRRPVQNIYWGKPQIRTLPGNSNYNKPYSFGSALKSTQYSYKPNYKPKNTQYVAPRFSKQNSTTKTSPPSVTDNNNTKSDWTDYKSKLNNYCQKAKIRPEYELQRTNDGGFACELIIGNDSFGSGVRDTKQEAEQSVAEDACIKLGIWNSKPDLPKMEVVNVEVLKERVKKVVHKRPNGLWSTRLPHEYRDMYNEEPPDGLPKYLSKWADILRVEEVAGTDRTIMYPVKESPVTVKQDIKFPKLNISDALLPSVGQTINLVFLSYIVNAQEFYVQYSDSKINDLMLTIKEIYESRGSPAALHDADHGTNCIAQYSEDLGFYRANILKKYKENDQIFYDVEYIDYGNREKIPADRTRRILDTLCVTARQCIRCKLDAVYPLHGKWGADSNSRIQEFMAEGVALEVKDIKESNEAVVRLYHMGKCLNKVLVEEGFASPVKKSFDPPSSIELPTSDEWEAFVSYIDSTTKVVIRLYGPEYSDALEALEEKIASLLSNPPLEAVVAGLICACVSKDENQEVNAHRVKVLDTKPGNKCEVEFLDHGGSEVVPFSSLRLLHPDLNKLPYQKVEVKLTGLEAYDSDSCLLEKIQDMAVGKNVIATVDDRVGKISVTLFDTSGAQDVNLNQEVANLVLAPEELKPRLPGVMETMEAFVCHVHDNGNVSFQLSGPGYQRLVEIEAEISQLYQEGCSAAHYIADPQPGMKVAVYQAEYKSWYRGRITETQGRQSEILLVDYGYYVVCLSSSLRVLPISAESLPPQAVECKLFGLPPSGDSWTQPALERLSQILPPDELRVIEMIHLKGEDKLPEIEVYFHKEDVLISVSEVLTYEEELFKASSEASSEDVASKDCGTDPVSADLVFDEPTPSASLETMQISPSKIPLPKTPPRPDAPVPPGTPASVSEIPLPVTPRQSPAPEPATFHNTSIDMSCQTDPYLLEGIISSLQTLGRPGDSGGSGESPALTPPPASTNNNVYATIKELDPADDYYPGLAKLPSSGENIFITWTSDPHNFRCVKEGVLERLGEMGTEMNEYYTKNQLPAVHYPEKGKLYAGQFTDGNWYRVKIMMILDLETQMVSIKFVDYGDCHVLSTNNLRLLPGRFRKLPLQAINGRVAGVEPVSGTWSAEAMELFKARALEKVLTAWIHSKPGTSISDHISMTLLSGETFIHKELIDSGLATKGSGSYC